MRPSLEAILRWSPDLQVEPAASGGALLLSEQAWFPLVESPYEELAALVDGRRTVQEILEAAAPALTPHEVFFALRDLLEQGYLVELPPGSESPLVGFWSALGAEPGSASERVASTPVSVVGGGEPLSALLAEALRGAGLDVRPEATLRVVVTDDYLSPELEAFSERARAEGVTWLPLKPGGRLGWFGPLIRPSQGACWHCLTERLRMNRAAEQVAGVTRRPLPSPPAAVSACLQVAAVQLARWIASGPESDALDPLITLDHRTLEVKRHPVTRLPHCARCGQPAQATARAGAPLVLSPQPKRFTRDGGHRICSPEETSQRLASQLSPLTGIISGVNAVPRSEPAPWTTFAAHYSVPVRPGDTLRSLQRRFSSGKGVTEAQAQASALCEAIERYHCFLHGDEPRVHARAHELDAPHVPPHELLHFSEAQYRERASWNERVHDSRQCIPAPVSSDALLDWTPAWSLTHQARRYLPTALCYEVPPPAGEPFCFHNYHGHAAGNVLEEAILQGFLELVERDAIALWWYPRVQRPQVALERFGSPWIGSIQQWYRERGWRLQVVDITTDLGIPVFAAAAYAPAQQQLYLGFGCHLEASLGVQRALTELNQMLDWGRASGDDESQRVDPEALEFLLGESALPAKDPSDYTAQASGDLREDILTCVERTRALGMDFLVVDQTRPEVGFPVVKVVVPPLRHHWPRFGPGRLYDVPVKLGWRRAPVEEAALNPFFPF